MARPIKNNLEYFQHENSMRNDPKIRLVRTKFGDEGYAVYNMTLEYLAEKELLQAANTEGEIELIASDFGKTPDRIKEIFEVFTKPHIDLIQIADGFIRCKQLDKRARGLFDERKRSLEELRDAISEFPSVFPEFPKSFRPENPRDNSQENTHSRVEYSREKKRRVNNTQKSEEIFSGKTKYLDFVFLSTTEHETLLARLGQKFLNRCIEILDSYIENNDKGKKYKNHYKVILNWVIQRVSDEGLKPEPCDPAKLRVAEAAKAKIDQALSEGAAEVEARRKQIQNENEQVNFNLCDFTKNIGRKI